MRVYVDPITTTSLPVLLFAAEHRHPLQVTFVRLSSNEPLVQLDLSIYRNVLRWMDLMRARPAWNEVRGEWHALRASLATQRASACA